MFDNLCKSWPRESQQCINRLKNKQTSYRVLNTVLIKVLYERCGSWPQKCYGDGCSTGWLRHFIATRPYEFFNFRSAEARSDSDLPLRIWGPWVLDVIESLDNFLCFSLSSRISPFRKHSALFFSVGQPRTVCAFLSLTREKIHH